MILGLTACTNPLKQTEEEESVEKEEIQGVHMKEYLKDKTFKVGVSPDFAPFSYLNDDGDMEGFDIDYLDEISQYLGFDYTLVIEQMDEIEQDLESGQIDFAISGISVTDSRSKKFQFTDTYYETSMTLVKNGDVEVTNRREMEDLKIGAEEGTAACEYLLTYMSENNKIKSYENMTKVFKKLEKGKIDAALADATTIDYYLENHPDSKIVTVETGLNSDQSNYAIMCGEDFEYVDAFNVAMKQIDLDGVYQELYNQWFH